MLLKQRLTVVEAKAKWACVEDLAMVLLRQGRVVPCFYCNVTYLNKFNRLQTGALKEIVYFKLA